MSIVSGVQFLCHRIRNTQTEIQMKMDISRNVSKNKNILHSPRSTFLCANQMLENIDTKMQATLTLTS